ncbi:hypothetical protein [Bradyrhizobium sp.]|uniref:hypothetical protein n=1 Tax=Bradyrhizobium sp. TaxID=376 RepID=UPI0039C89F89
MKSWLLAAVLGCTVGTACMAQGFPGYTGFWVVGNHATNRCEIVTSNPVIDYTTIWFGTGPYQSLDDAKLARSTISACPKENAASAGSRNPEDGASDSPR